MKSQEGRRQVSQQSCTQPQRGSSLLSEPKVIAKHVRFICTVAKQTEAAHMSYKKDEKKWHNNFANTYWQK